MSTVFVHVGQAGCQIANALWPALACERASSPDLFYHNVSDRAGLPHPRAVLVDAEPKVIQSMLSVPGPNHAFDPDASAWSQSGRGGNFALGYGGQRGAGESPSSGLLGHALECVRHQVERCNGTHLGTVLMHSLGGGSGSGLGARVCEEIRDAYPQVPLLVASVLPLSAGENPAQSLNAILALASVQESADGIILLENDRLLASAEASKPAADVGAGHCGSLGMMNAILARDLLPLLCPPVPAVPLDTGELLAFVCPMPTHRFTQVLGAQIAAPHNTPPTDLRPLLGALTRGAPRVARPATPGGGNVLAMRAVFRGVQPPPTAVISSELLGRFGGAAVWQPHPVDARSSAVFLRSTPSVACASAIVNWKRSGQVLRDVLGRARKKYSSRMFTHWYDSHGFGADVFANAFETISDVVANYEAS